MTKIYVILPNIDLTQAMVDDCNQTSLSTVRKSIDGTMALLSYSGTKPNSISAYTDFNKSQILTEMAKPEWSSE